MVRLTFRGLVLITERQCWIIDGDKFSVDNEQTQETEQNEQIQGERY